MAKGRQHPTQDFSGPQEAHCSVLWPVSPEVGTLPDPNGLDLGRWVLVGGTKGPTMILPATAPKGLGADRVPGDLRPIGISHVDSFVFMQSWHQVKGRRPPVVGVWFGPIQSPPVASRNSNSPSCHHGKL